MNVKDKRRYDVLIRVRNFGNTYGQLFPTTSTAHEALATVNAEIERLEELDIAERTSSQNSLRARKLSARERFEPIVIRAGMTTKVLARTHRVLEGRFHQPLPPDDLALLTMARQIAGLAEPFAAEFAAHGIPIPEFQEAVAAFEKAVMDRGSGRDDRVKAKIERDAAFDRAFAAVDTFDVTVANYLASDPAALALWEHDRRETRSRKRPKRGADTPSAPAADAVGRDPRSGPGESAPAAA